MAVGGSGAPGNGGNGVRDSEGTARKIVRSLLLNFPCPLRQGTGHGGGCREEGSPGGRRRSCWRSPQQTDMPGHGAGGSSKKAGREQESICQAGRAARCKRRGCCLPRQRTFAARGSPNQTSSPCLLHVSASKRAACHLG